MATYTSISTANLTDADINQLAVLSTESAHPNQATMVETDFDQLYYKYKSRPRSACIRAWDGDKLVGQIFMLNQHPSTGPDDNTGSHFVRMHKANCDTFLEAYNLTYDLVCMPSLLYTHPDYRGQGIGKQTLLAGHAWAKENGYTHIMGYGSFNPESLAFYKHNSNYIQTDISHGWEGYCDTDTETFSFIEL